MLFNDHSDLAGMHSFLSPSKYHWINYDDDKLIRVFGNARAAEYGTRLHAFAHEAIQLGILMPRGNKTLNRYINDAIRYRMRSEQILFYSPDAFGTADTICFRNNKLRIHDLKTGVVPAKLPQLEVLAAYFCLEYGYNPEDIEIELRIYQNDNVEIWIADPVVIRAIMNKAEHAVRLINEHRMEGV